MRQKVGYWSMKTGSDPEEGEIHAVYMSSGRVAAVICKTHCDLSRTAGRACFRELNLVTSRMTSSALVVMASNLRLARGVGLLH